jgi:hypothetical protein
MMLCLRIIASGKGIAVPALYRGDGRLASDMAIATKGNSVD